MKIAYLFLALLFGVRNAQCGDNELEEGLLNQENQIFTIKDIHGDVLASIPSAVMQKLSPTLGNHSFDGYEDQYSLTLDVDNPSDTDLPREALPYLFAYINSIQEPNNSYIMEVISSSDYAVDLFNFAGVWGFESLRQQLLGRFYQFMPLLGMNDKSLEDVDKFLNFNKDEMQAIANRLLKNPVCCPSVKECCPKLAHKPRCCQPLNKVVCPSPEDY